MNVITMSAIAVTLFLGGPSGPSLGFLAGDNVLNVWVMPMFWFLVKVLALLFATVWLRASLPRMRYDRLMALGWKYLIEIAILWVLVTATVHGRAQSSRLGSPRSWRRSRCDRRVRSPTGCCTSSMPKPASRWRSSADGPLLRVPASTLRQMCKPRVTTRVPEGEARQARAPARPPRPQPLRGRHGEVHRLRALRGRVPGALHLRARRRQPGRRPGVTGRALRLRLRDQLPALHPLRSLRRGVPDRGDHRDEAVRVLVHESQRRDLHQGRARSSTTTAGRGGCRGSCGWAERTTTRARGCVPPRPPGAPRTRAASAGPASSASAYGRPSRASFRRDASRRRRLDEYGPATDAVDLLRLRGRARRGALGVVLARNPVHSRTVPAAHARQRRGAVPAAARARSSPRSRSSSTPSAIVVLFVFVITLLGVDQHEPLDEPHPVPAARGRHRRSARSCSREIAGARARQPLGHRRALDPRCARAPRIGQRRDARDEPVHRLLLGVRDHRSPARDRGRRQACSPAAAARAARAGPGSSTGRRSERRRRRDRASRTASPPAYYLVARPRRSSRSARSACSCAGTPS